MSMSFRWLVFGLAALLFNFPLISTLLTSLKSVSYTHLTLPTKRIV